MESATFIPGHSQISPEPLARYLPPLQVGIVSSWLKTQFPNSNSKQKQIRVLDPFGASPRLAAEAASAGHCVVVVVVNPVMRFLFEMAANQPTKNELRAAIADLGASLKGDQRIEPFINSLYQTECYQCQHTVIAKSFIWERGASGPSKRLFDCPHCGISGVYPTTPDDIDRAEQFSRSGLHHALALERVAPINDPDRERVEEALASYLPRALYVIFTLLNKIEGKNHQKQTLLKALLLSACDRANTLWQYPTSRARPRQLTVPPQFYEHNIWLAMEDAIHQWTTSDGISAASIPLTMWPDLPPPGGGICLYEGRLKDFKQEYHHPNPQKIKTSAVIMAVPRLNQAFWTLSAVWSGWLWGRSASAQFKGVLRRRRFDWAWHTKALYTTFSQLSTLLDDGVPFLGLIGELEPAFLSAALLSAELAGIDLSSIALREETQQAQIHWTYKTSPISHPMAGNRSEIDQKIVNLVNKASKQHLVQRREPADYNYLHASSLLELAQTHIIRNIPELSPSDILGRIHDLIPQALLASGDFARYGGSDHSLEVGLWWLSGKDKTIRLPLADRIEKECVRFLLKNPECTFTELEISICEQFPGLFTPSAEEIKLCLESYSEKLDQESDFWSLRPQDRPKARKSDLINMQQSLLNLADRLGYRSQVNSERSLTWMGANKEIKCTFYVIASAIISELVLESTTLPHQSIIVIPGGRSNLIAYKLRRDPRLAEIIASGWRIIKFRQVRLLEQDQNITKNNIDEQFGLDPPLSSDPQIPLF